MEQITVSDGKEHASYVAYLYNQLTSELLRQGGVGMLSFTDRCTLHMQVPSENPALKARITAAIAEIIAVGYKFEYLNQTLRVSLGKREKQLLCAALIAADYEGDSAYVRRKIGGATDFAIDGIYHFRLKRLVEKWDKIIGYVPVGFGSGDLQRFCEFLVGESRNKIYLRGNVVFGENFMPLKRSRLTGGDDLEMEILLSDAGFVYCLGDVEEEVGDFLQKYYAERAIFS